MFLFAHVRFFYLFCCPHHSGELSLNFIDGPETSPSYFLKHSIFLQIVAFLHLDETVPLNFYLFRQALFTQLVIFIVNFNIVLSFPFGVFVSSGLLNSLHDDFIIDVVGLLRQFIENSLSWFDSYFHDSTGF